jgi:hypothetical protein
MKSVCCQFDGLIMLPEVQNPLDHRLLAGIGIEHGVVNGAVWASIGLPSGPFMIARLEKPKAFW